MADVSSRLGSVAHGAGVCGCVRVCVWWGGGGGGDRLVCFSSLAVMFERWGWRTLFNESRVRTEHVRGGWGAKRSAAYSSVRVCVTCVCA